MNCANLISPSMVKASALALLCACAYAAGSPIGNCTHDHDCRLPCPLGTHNAGIAEDERKPRCDPFCAPLVADSCCSSTCECRASCACNDLPYKSRKVTSAFCPCSPVRDCRIAASLKIQNAAGRKPHTQHAHKASACATRPSPQAHATRATTATISASRMWPDAPVG